jgi:prophage tail gpP-like protein
MERFKDFQQLVSGFSDTDWLVDCAAMPHDYVRQAHVEQIMLEITRRIWDGKVSVPSEVAA